MTGPVAPWKSSAHARATRDAQLALLTDDLWRAYFHDIPRPNDIVVGYDFPWKRRLGRIRMTLDGRQSEIHLNGLLDHPDTPEFVRIAIITHEIVHYAQGFGSPLPRMQKHAHACGCVHHDLITRDLAQYEILLDRWAQDVWPNFEPRVRAERRARLLAPARHVAEVYVG